MPDFWTNLPDFYDKHLRDSLFTGMLTVGTFLFAVKTFIVIKIQEDVFEKPFYREKYLTAKALNAKKNKSFYGPLKWLTWALFIATMACFVSAVLQLTVGFLPSPFWVSVCILSAALSLLALLVSMCLVQCNLTVWLSGLEEKERKNSEPNSPNGIGSDGES